MRASELQTTVPHLGQMVRLYAALGLEREASEAVQQILSFLEEKRVVSVKSTLSLLIACQWLASHALPASMEKAHFCLDYLEKLARQYQVGEPAAALQEARGSVWLAEENPHQAAECFQQAAAEWASIHRRMDQARALGGMGRALKAAGNASSAKDAYRHADEIFHSLAAQLDPLQAATFLNLPLVQEAAQAAKAADRGKPSKTTRHARSELTDRELEVLKLVAQGFTNAQIADRLVLSPLTVNAHLRSIYSKLDVTTRTAAVHRASENGFL